MEILSPWIRKKDLQEKYCLYERSGVYVPDERVKVGILEELEIDLTRYLLNSTSLCDYGFKVVASNNIWDEITVVGREYVESSHINLGYYKSRLLLKTSCSLISRPG